MVMKILGFGSAELIHDTRDLYYTYKGVTTTIRAVTADFCPACDDSITDMAKTERVKHEMQAFNKQVNAPIADPIFIISVSKKLQLGQYEAAEILAVASMRSCIEKTGRPNGRWTWRSCSGCRIAALNC